MRTPAGAQKNAISFLPHIGSRQCTEQMNRGARFPQPEDKPTWGSSIRHAARASGFFAVPLLSAEKGEIVHADREKFVNAARDCLCSSQSGSQITSG